MRDLNVLDDLESFSDALAQRWLTLSQEAIRARGSFHVALAGGQTPRRLYQRLASAAYAPHIDWTHTWIYFGDERAVPPEHPDSNYRMVREALLDHVGIPPGQIFRIKAESADIEQAARAYAEDLDRHLPRGPNGIGQFDLVLLGLGEDGHTASLFPDTDILSVLDRAAAAVYVDKFCAWRISLTLPTINHARHVIVLAAGAAKARIVHAALGEPPSSRPLPIQRIQPTGALEWFLDRAAAEELSVPDPA